MLLGPKESELLIFFLPKNIEKVLVQVDRINNKENNIFFYLHNKLLIYIPSRYQ